MPYSSRVADQTVKDYFDGKPEALEIFEIVADKIAAVGPSKMTIGSQISFGKGRKFAWFWLYNVTNKNPNGVPHLMLAIDHQVDSDHVRSTEQISKHRWNHQIVVRSKDDAKSTWLSDLITLACGYGFLSSN